MSTATSTSTSVFERPRGSGGGGGGGVDGASTADKIPSLPKRNDYRGHLWHGINRRLRTAVEPYSDGQKSALIRRLDARADRSPTPPAGTRSEERRVGKEC